MRTVKRIARVLGRWIFTPYLTTRRLFNQLLLELHERLRLEKVRAYPETLIVETINGCDSTCRLCPVGEGRRARPVTVLDMETYRRFIDELAPWAQRVHFHNWGEPLLDKHLIERIRYAHERGLYTFIATTLYHLTPERADALVASGLNLVTVSLHGASQATYEAYQPGRSLDRVLGNIRTLVTARRRAGRSEPRILLHTIRSRKNEHELEQVQGLVDEFGVDGLETTETSINARFLWSDEHLADRGLSESQFRAEALQRAREWLPDDRLHEYDSAVPSGSKLSSCDRLWRIGLLNSDGSVPPCCDVMRPENDFDRYTPGRRFLDIWNNERFRVARRSFRKAGSGDLSVICTHCPGHASNQKARNPVRF